MAWMCLSRRLHDTFLLEKENLQQRRVACRYFSRLSAKECILSRSPHTTLKIRMKNLLQRQTNVHKLECKTAGTLILLVTEALC